MFCVSGFAGVGKDEFCKRLVSNHGAFHTGLIDPAKRHMGEVYGFSEDQLFGPSVFRNRGDLRYPKTLFTSHRMKKLDPSLVQKWDISVPSSSDLYYSRDFFVTDFSFSASDGSVYYVAEAGDPRFWLSPREALQLHGELYNELYENTWVRKGVETHIKLGSGNYSYSRMEGVHELKTSIPQSSIITCFSDFRHIHEFEYVKACHRENPIFQPVFVRIKTKRVPKPSFSHKSETEQLQIPDSSFHYVIENDGSKELLHQTVDQIIQYLTTCSEMDVNLLYEEIYLR